MNLLRALATVSSLTTVSRVLGLARDVLIARGFGAALATDAFFVAFRLPNLLRRLFAEGAFSQAFVPVLAEHKNKTSAEEVRGLIDRTATLLFLALTATALLGIALAPAIVYVTAPGFAAEPDKFALTVTMLRIVFPYIAFISLVAFAAGLAVGLRPRAVTPAPTTRPSRHGGWLAAELKLTPEQQEQMEKIWSETAFRGRHDREEQRRELARRRDQAIADLIRPEDKPKYEQALKAYSDQVEALDNESRLAFQAAVEQTKQILTPEQRTRYEQLRQHQESERGRHDRRGREHDEDRERGHSHSAPASS